MEGLMKKRLSLAFVVFFILVPVLAVADDQPMLSISGAVRQPLNLSLEDLQEYQSTRVQLNEIVTDGQYNGVFYYRGVPLRILLETAYIEKKETIFSKCTDVAVVVKNSKGQQVALSWGEIFYRNPGDCILATSAAPIMPHRDCSACHEPDEYQPRLDKLQRKIGFPKLVIPGDVYSDRSLDGINEIRVLDLRPQTTSKKGGTLFSAEVDLRGTENPLTLKDLASFPRASAIFRHVGEGKGYHGVNRIEGASLRSVLEESGIKADLNQVFLVSAPDGYRSLFSYGEIFLNPVGERVIIADKIDGQSIEEGGKFWLIPPDDAMADRTVKAVQKIEIIHIQ
jgi:DMSO/TMAO reductase YedYZ molybdopterin-dependent catalytic subunit